MKNIIDNQYLNVIGFGGLFINAILLVIVATHKKEIYVKLKGITY